MWLPEAPQEKSAAALLERFVEILPGGLKLRGGAGGSRPRVVRINSGLADKKNGEGRMRLSPFWLNEVS
jgi:hypothetical protein